MYRLFIVVITGVLFPFIGISQTTTNTENIKKYNEKVFNLITIPKPIDSLDLKNTYKIYIDDYKRMISSADSSDKANFIAYNNAVLNLYFEDNITSYATSINDLSLEKYFLSADTDNKKLTIGRSIRLESIWPWIFPFKKKEKKKIKYERIFGYYNKSLVQEYKELQKLNYVFTFYLTTPLSSGFSKLYSYDKSVEDYKFNNNIGAGGKLTKFFKGFINFKNRKNFRENYEIKDYLEVSNDSMFSEVYEMKAIRDSILNKKIPKKIDSYLVGDYQYDKKLVEITAKDIKEKKQNLLYSKYLEFYKEIAEAEIDYAKDKKLITGSRYGWLSFEYYFAITQTQLTTSIDSVNTTKHDFRAWRASVSYNYLWNFVTDTFWKDFSIKPSFLVSYFNTNNFIASGNTTNIFQPILRVSESQQVLGTSEAVYLGDFNTFKAFAFKGGLSSLFFNNTIGLSASYELTTGEITNQNWKLGIPISLKDKKNKPTVNFEIQWREINKEHMLGISVGYNFGKFVQ